MDYKEKVIALLKSQELSKEQKEKLEEIFPELKESEDERIRRQTLKILNYYNDVEKLEGRMPAEIDECIAWLEAQGEQKPVDKVEPKFKVGEWVVVDDDGRTGRIIECTKDYADVDLEFSCLSTRVNNIRSWTIQDAKDGDILLSPSTPEGDKECPFIFKEIDKDGIVRFYAALLQSERLKIADGITNVIGYANAGYHIPATKEQRDQLEKAMTDAGYTFDFEKKELKKVEHKPNPCDGCVNRKGCINCENGELREVEQKPAWSEEDERTYKSIMYSFAHNYQLTIQQQEFVKSLKDGIQPTKEWSEEDIELLNNTIKFIEDSVAATPPSLRTYNPTLTGKEISFLKALKDRVQPKQEWKQENTGDLTDFENAMMCVGNSFFGQYAGLDPNDTNAIKEQANLLLELVPSKEWSEEDESLRRRCIGAIDMANLSEYTKDNLLNWLKSLKDRAYPKQEWSEEDNRMCKAIIDNIQAICKEGYFVGNIDSDELIKWLKFLKDRYTWKPSDEQIEYLAAAVEESNENPVLDSLYQDLKKFRKE